jgi:drug/metabolite transporter (DMT)-like permease
MNNTRPILLMVAAMAMFTLADTLIKVNSATLPMGEILIALGLGGGTVFAILCRSRAIPILSRNYFHPAIMLRNLCELLGTMCFTLALAWTPISSASAILQATPLLVTLGAAVFYKEPVGWRRWSAIAVGMFGVMLVIKPGMDGFDPLSILAVFGAIFLSARDLATRNIPKNIFTTQVALYGFLSVLPAGVLLLMITGGAMTPTISQISILIAMICFASLGYFAITSSVRMGDLSAVTPFRYTRIVFAIAVGWFIFGERPDTLTYVGAAIIVLSGLYTLARERKVASSLS